MPIISGEPDVVFPDTTRIQLYLYKHYQTQYCFMYVTAAALQNCCCTRMAPVTDGMITAAVLLLLFLLDSA